MKQTKLGIAQIFLGVVLVLGAIGIGYKIDNVRIEHDSFCNDKGGYFLESQRLEQGVYKVDCVFKQNSPATIKTFVEDIEETIFNNPENVIIFLLPILALAVAGLGLVLIGILSLGYTI